jgi:hypothetical protein
VLKMGLGDITFGGNNVRFGNDADKPVSPNPGDEYIALDTRKKYVCYTPGVWADLNPAIPALSSDYNQILQKYSASTNVLYTDSTEVILDDDGDYENYDWMYISQIKPSNMILHTEDTFKIKFDVFCQRNSGDCKTYVELRKSDGTVLDTYTGSYDADWYTITRDVIGLQAGEIIELWGKASNWTDGYTDVRRLKNFSFLGEFVSNTASPTYS